jgi:hypothetical protein
VVVVVVAVVVVVVVVVVVAVTVFLKVYHKDIFGNKLGKRKKEMAFGASMIKFSSAALS